MPFRLRAAQQLTLPCTPARILAVMSSLPELSISDVRDWTVDRYHERGEGYFHDGRIHHTRRHAHTLKALCRGSRPNPYRVEVTLAPDGIGAGLPIRE